MIYWALCKIMWKKQPDSSIQNNWRGRVSSGWFRDSIHLYVHICVNPDVTDGYLTDTTAGFCFCVFVFVWKSQYKPGKLVVFETTKHWMHLGKDMFETPQWQQIVLPLIFLFQRLFLLFSYCSFCHRQSKFTSVLLFLCTRVSSEVGYVLCFHMGDLTVTFFAFCAQ